MSINVPLVIVLGGIVSCGAYLLMDRSLIKMLLGLMLVGNAVNILIAGAAITASTNLRVSLIMILPRG